MNGQNRDMRSSSAYRPGTRPYSGQQAQRRPQQGTVRSGQAQYGQRSSYSRSYPQRQPGSYSQQNRRPAQQTRQPAAQRNPQYRRPVQQRRGASAGKTVLGVIKKILQVIAGVFLAIFGGIFALLKKANRKLDVFRKSETSAVLVNCILGAIAVCILLVIFLALKPGMDSSRARSLAAKGDATAALRIVSQLENRDYNAEKLAATKLAVTENLISAGKHSEAASLLAELPESAETIELAQRSKYAQASDLYEAGSYSAAAQIFYQMNDYQDAALRYADCRCALAVEAYLAGNESSAHSLLLDVPDVFSRVQAAALKVSGGDAAQAQAILSAEIFSEDSLNRMEATMASLTAARSDMPEGRIAAGERHTLGVNSSGVVYAAGDNSYGQTNVGSWTNITQVAAGAYHSVGLRADGTVVAVGDNSQKQCDVSGWTDIVAIAAAAYDTIGLKSDGSVLASGMHASAVSGWHGVTHVTGGSYSMGCLYDKGAMLSTHDGAQMDMGVVLYDLSVSGAVSVGVLYDGTLISTYENAPDWQGMISAVATETCILGVDVNGQVRYHPYRQSEAMQISVPAQAVEVESSGTHHVVLTADGRVYGFGNNDYGQCNLSDWLL